MKGDVPTPEGNIHIEMTRKEIIVRSEGCGNGTVCFKSAKRPKVSCGTVKSLGGNVYQLNVESGTEIRITYTALK